MSRMPNHIKIHISNDKYGHHGDGVNDEFDDPVTSWPDYRGWKMLKYLEKKDKDDKEFWDWWDSLSDQEKEQEIGK
tara:strand:- start:59 stop:286 length:228 start_codon:yes stop_codon:yes gene_type:complete